MVTLCHYSIIILVGWRGEGDQKLPHAIIFAAVSHQLEVDWNTSVTFPKGNVAELYEQV